MITHLLGLPFDGASSFLRGPASAPAAVRDALTSGSANWCTEAGLDLDPERRDDWVDRGDLDIPDAALDAVAIIRAGAAAALDDGGRLVAIGGDHLVTFPLMQAMAQHHDDITIVHVDAHPDLYDQLDGDPLSHACPFARIMEAGLARRLIQVGIRTATPHQRAQAERFGVEMLEARSWDGTLPTLDGPVYVSIDVDGLDPAFAPGVSHFEPGGLSTRELLGVLEQVGGAGVPVIGGDVVEINPDRDPSGMTAMVGAKLVRELLGLTLTSPR